MEVNWSAAPPELWTWAVRPRGVPTATISKSRVAGSRLMTGPAEVVAVPLTPRLAVGFIGSLLAMARQAPAGRAPAALGAKVTPRFVLAPAATVNGPAGVQV